MCGSCKSCLHPHSCILWGHLLTGILFPAQGYPEHEGLPAAQVWELGTCQKLQQHQAPHCGDSSGWAPLKEVQPKPAFPEAEPQAWHLLKVSHSSACYGGRISSSWVPPEGDPTPYFPVLFKASQSITQVVHPAVHATGLCLLSNPFAYPLLVLAEDRTCGAGDFSSLGSFLTFLFHPHLALLCLLLTPGSMVSSFISFNNKQVLSFDSNRLLNSYRKARTLVLLPSADLLRVRSIPPSLSPMKRCNSTRPWTCHSSLSLRTPERHLLITSLLLDIKTLPTALWM